MAAGLQFDILIMVRLVNEASNERCELFDLYSLWYLITYLRNRASKMGVRDSIYTKLLEKPEQHKSVQYVRYTILGSSNSYSMLIRGMCCADLTPGHEGSKSKPSHYNNTSIRTTLHSFPRNQRPVMANRSTS